MGILNNKRKLRKAATLLAVYASDCIEAQSKYDKDPTDDNKRAWLKFEDKIERQIIVVQQKQIQCDEDNNLLLN